MQLKKNITLVSAIIMCFALCIKVVHHLILIFAFLQGQYLRTSAQGRADYSDRENEANLFLVRE